jgi:hypothetical protein
MTNLSGPQPDNPHAEIAPIVPRQSIRGTPLWDEGRLPARKVGIKKSPARIIERLPLCEGTRNKPD